MSIIKNIAILLLIFLMPLGVYASKKAEEGKKAKSDDKNEVIALMQIVNVGAKGEKPQLVFRYNGKDYQSSKKLADNMLDKWVKVEGKIETLKKSETALLKVKSMSSMLVGSVVEGENGQRFLESNDGVKYLLKGKKVEEMPMGKQIGISGTVRKKDEVQSLDVKDFFEPDAK